MVLEVCGIDGLGHPYDSEILVFRSGDELLGIQPVFWTGLRIAEGDTTKPRPRPTPRGPPAQGVGDRYHSGVTCPPSPVAR